MANIELDGANKKIKVDSGDLTLDVPGDIILDADGADLVFADGGTNILKITNSSSDVVLQPQVDAKDIKFNQYDGRTLLDINDGGYVGIANGATGPGQLRLYEDTDNGTNYTAFQVGTQSGDITYTLPTADGSNGQVLTTNGSGTLSFSTVSGTTINNNADNLLITGSGTANTLNAEAKLISDGSGIIIRNASVGTATSGKADMLVIEGNASGDTAGMSILTANDEFGVIHFGDDADVDVGKIEYYHGSDYMRFYTNGSERMRITSAGYVFIGTQVDGVYNDSSGAGGFNLNPTSTVALATNDARPLMLNRIDSDGTLISFFADGGNVGTISNSGSTVSYNAFCGSHWSRLADNSKPTILRGTVMESISTLCDWYQVKFTFNKDKDGNVIEPAIVKKESIALPSGKSVGDIIKHTYQGVEHDAEIIKESNERLPMCKISNTEDSKSVYGVFMDWDDNDDGLDGDVNDMYVTSLGAFVVRIHKDETVAIGDYLQSKGDGTAKKQADDILRSSTIAKVTSTEKTHTYSDGSYCVPCTLHCG